MNVSGYRAIIKQTAGVDRSLTPFAQAGSWILAAPDGNGEDPGSRLLGPLCEQEENTPGP
jgi:hypothetical protein